METFRRNYIKNYIGEVRQILANLETEIESKLDKFTTLLFQVRNNKKAIFIMGNGGSASTSSHFICDLIKGTIIEDFPRFKAISLTDNIPTMLAWANDANYEDIFVEQLKNFLEPGDIVIGISGSGNSKNVIKAIEYANSQKAITIGLSGYDGGKLLKTAQENIHVPSFNMQHVEDVHMILVHLWTSLIRDEQKKNDKP